MFSGRILFDAVLCWKSLNPFDFPLQSFAYYGQFPFGNQYLLRRLLYHYGQWYLVVICFNGGFSMITNSEIWLSSNLPGLLYDTNSFHWLSLSFTAASLWLRTVTFGCHYDYELWHLDVIMITNCDMWLSLWLRTVTFGCHYDYELWHLVVIMITNCDIWLSLWLRTVTFCWHYDYELWHFSCNEHDHLGLLEFITSGEFEKESKTFKKSFWFFI